MLKHKLNYIFLVDICAKKVLVIPLLRYVDMQECECVWWDGIISAKLTGFPGVSGSGMTMDFVWLSLSPLLLDVFILSCTGPRGGRSRACGFAAVCILVILQETDMRNVLA